MREIQRPLVGWQIGALGLCAQVAQKALIDNFAIVGLVYAVHLEGVGLVNQVE